jgi:arabinogalactan endo-1,4-beta-galactosidase
MYDFTYDVLLSLKNQGTMPEMVQVGNEISSGMMWKVAKVSDKFDTEERWDKLCSLLKSGLSAVKDVDNSIQSIIHIEKGGDNEGCRYFYDKLVQHDVNFDIIGLSFYPIWHGTVTSFQNNILDFAARYQKGVIAVETAYPYTTESGDDQPNSTTFPFTKIPSDYPPSIQNQANMIQAIIFALKSVPNQKGLGYFYWQPDFIPVKGAGWKYGEGCEWDDQTMFDFSGHALWSLDIFKIHCSDADFRN